MVERCPGARPQETRHDQVRCDRCGWTDEDHSAPVTELRCPQCNDAAYKRPDIVWFGDNLDPANLAAVSERLRRCDLLVSIGTSAVVYPAADMPLIAKQAGATLVEVNPEPTPLSVRSHWCSRPEESPCRTRQERHSPGNAS